VNCPFAFYLFIYLKPLVHYPTSFIILTKQARMIFGNPNYLNMNALLGMYLQ